METGDGPAKGSFLKENKTTVGFISGLATKYCVKCFVLDACLLGFNTFVTKDAVRSIDLNPEDIERAF
jgi:nicotinamidase-related amidase